MNRPTINTVLMSNALAWSLRSTCPLRQVGAVIADHSGRVVSSGYNGAPAGMEHCTHECNCDAVAQARRGGEHWPGCPMLGSCTDAVHAEENAIVYAARAGVSTYGKRLVTTYRPCLRCARMILAAGIDLVVFKESTSDTAGLDLLHAGGVTSLHLAGMSELETS